MSMPNRPVTEPTKAQRLVWCVGVMGGGIQIVLQWWVRVGLGHNRASCAFAGWAWSCEQGRKIGRAVKGCLCDEADPT